MSAGTIRKVLRDFGLTEKEGEVYIFLAAHGALKSREIAVRLKKDKAQIFRLLETLQAKGLVESTIEFPARFAAVPFENVLDASIKSKKEEVASIENAKKDLLNYLKKTSQIDLEPSLEKFVVIEGTKRINLKGLEMIQKAKHRFSAVIPASQLSNHKKSSFIEEAFSHMSKSNIAFRLLTEASGQNQTILKNLLKNKKTDDLNLETRTPELGLTLFPQMDIKDDDEALFFIRSTADVPISQKEVCLWTNCKPLVQAFNSVFENLWQNSVDIHEKIGAIEKDEETTETGLIKNAVMAQQKYLDALRSTKEEIAIVTSAEGLISSWRNISLLKELAARDVSIKIMAPITSDNLQAVEELSEFCNVKHVSSTYLGTTVIDAKHMFQFSEREQTKPEATAYFENTFYTNNSDFLLKTKNMLDDIWMKAYKPSTISLKSIIKEVKSEFIPFPNVPISYMKKLGATNIIDEKPSGTITEKDVVDKIMNPKRYLADCNDAKVIDKMYSTVGLAVIHPPDYFNLPDTMLVIHKIDKQSRLGEEDAMVVFLWLETPKGYNYVPVAIVGDNPKAHDFWKTCLASTIAGKNAQLIRKEEIEVRVHGNTLFAGWTVPIPLLLPKYILPPACILIEGYGDVKTAAYTTVMPLGNKCIEQNYFDAFVTFMHPSSKYSGPGTDGYFVRDSISTLYSRERKASNNMLSHGNLERE